MFQEGWRRRELIWNLVSRNLKIRYKGSALGFFWTLANPLFNGRTVLSGDHPADDPVDEFETASPECLDERKGMNSIYR